MRYTQLSWGSALSHIIAHHHNLIFMLLNMFPCGYIQNYGRLLLWALTQEVIRVEYAKHENHSCLFHKEAFYADNQPSGRVKDMQHRV